MANYRQIHTVIWKDSWFLDLSPQEKLLFIYLFSNERTSLSGLYELSIKVISFETGLSISAITRAIEKFGAAHKVYMEGNVVWVVHMRKFHETKSDTVLKRIQADIDSVSECDLKNKYLADTVPIPYAYPIDTVPIPHMQLKEEEKEKEEENKSSGGVFFEPLKIFREVTGMATIPASQIEAVLPALESLFYEHDRNADNLVAFLKPYFEAWTKRKGKNGAAYSKANCSWLYDWSIAGEVPNESKPRTKIMRDADGVATEVEI